MKDYIKIDLSHIHQGLQIELDAQVPRTIFETEDAEEHTEARIQLVEGAVYNFELPKAYRLEKSAIVQHHPRKKHIGTISPNIYVGTLSIPIFKNEEEIATLSLEVRSRKTGYRDDYRDMLEFITEKCTDLLLQSSSPVSHHFETDYAKESETLYQKFAFVKSVIGKSEFTEAIHRIVSAPVTQWKEEQESVDVRNVRRFTNANLKELVKGNKRTVLPPVHYLRRYGLASLPEKLSTVRKTDSVDTPENRFVKHTLEVFLKFSSDINRIAKNGSRLYNESTLLMRDLENHLHHSVFKEISRPSSLKLNSPVLQRKEGYREVLRAWLMFDLAAKLIWHGGEDVYSAGKKDIATLYEYWLFFKLIELLEEVFELEAKDVQQLIEPTNHNLNLRLKQGRHTAISGIYDAGTRKLNIKFNYNRSFSGRNDYPASGSWTTTMRPDYTLSIWPEGIDESKAEREELIVHIHFDAKYKVIGVDDLLGENSLEKEENRKGIYKNADLLKMHAYKDAIRRTGGAYVLYPGDTALQRTGFHEIIPGLGAFPVRPSRMNSGIGELKVFIYEVIGHFINRASQRENLANKVYKIHKNSKPNQLKEPLPEYVSGKKLIPDDTYVLLGYSKGKEYTEWFKQSGLYNFRMNDKKGSLEFEAKTASAEFLILREKGKEYASLIFKVKSRKIYTGERLMELGHPKATADHYLVYEIETGDEALSAFENVKWDFKKMDAYKKAVEGEGVYSRAGKPFTVSLTELMEVRI